LDVDVLPELYETIRLKNFAKLSVSGGESFCPGMVLRIMRAMMVKMRGTRS